MIPRMPLLAGVALATALSLDAATMQATRADDFVESIGVNLKLDRSQYTYSTRVRPIVEDLGVRYYRDGRLDNTTYRANYRELWEDLGAKLLLVAVPYEGTRDLNPLNIRNRVRDHGLDFVWALEGANEPDIFLVQGYGWDFHQYTDRFGTAHTNTSSNYYATRAYHNDMYFYMKGDTATASVPVTSTAMAFSNNVSKITTIQADWGAFHHYTHREPVNYNLGTVLTQTGWYGASPIICTEFGWKTSGSNSVSEKAQANNIISAYLEYYRLGVQTSFLHELNHSDWGIMVGDTKKKAYHALKNTIALFGEAVFDPQTLTWSRPTFTPRALDITFSGKADATRAMLFEHSDGDFLLAFNRLRDRVNNDGTDIAGDSDVLSFSVAEGIVAATAYQFDADFGLVATPLTIEDGNAIIDFEVPNGNAFIVFTPAAPGAILPILGEAETRRTSASKSVQTYNNVEASAGKFVRLDATAVGDHITLTLPSIPAGEYWVRLRHQLSAGNAGRFTVTANQQPLGGVIDQYDATNGGTFREDELGLVELTAQGDLVLRFQVDGKNASSTGYQIRLDSVVLLPVIETTYPFEAESNWTWANRTVTQYSNTNASGGSFIRLDATAVNDAVVVTLPDVAPGDYQLVVHHMQSANNAGRYIVKVNGASVGGTYDQYGSTGGFFVAQEIAPITITQQGSVQVRLQVQGKDAASSGYQLRFDRVDLITTD